MINGGILPLYQKAVMVMFTGGLVFLFLSSMWKLMGISVDTEVKELLHYLKITGKTLKQHGIISVR